MINDLVLHFFYFDNPLSRIRSRNPFLETIPANSKNCYNFFRLWFIASLHTGNNRCKVRNESRVAVETALKCCQEVYQMISDLLVKNLTWVDFQIRVCVSCFCNRNLLFLAGPLSFWDISRARAFAAWNQLVLTCIKLYFWMKSDEIISLTGLSCKTNNFWHCRQVL